MTKSSDLKSFEMLSWKHGLPLRTCQIQYIVEGDFIISVILSSPCAQSITIASHVWSGAKVIGGLVLLAGGLELFVCQWFAGVSVSIPHIKEEIWSKREIGFKESPHFTRNEFSPPFTMDLKTFVETFHLSSLNRLLLGYPVAEHLANDLKDAGTLRQPLGSIPSWASVFSSIFFFVGDCHLASLELRIEFDICGRVGRNILASPFGEALLFNLIPFFWE